ncbi:MAG: adenosylmethionine--8-amino-7-oxononanoate transaminase [Acidimicrobiaceae bacterium]|nr:adenosylmethionine--8-amino-7-oxononanoate transaminase [Acidimicrobiaceae bacterium]
MEGRPAAPPAVTTADWARRDAAVVWHGFTQMATYEGSPPVIVDRGEGNYLYDTDGRRYLDAISSLWVITLGHSDPDLNRAAREQLERISHSTLLGNGNTAAITLAEALREVVPVTEPHFLFASDGATAVEQAIKIAFQYWHNLGVRGRNSYLTLGDAYHGDSVGSLSVGDGGFGTDLFDPLRFGVLRTPGYDDPDWVSKAIAVLDEHHDRLAAAIVEPLVQGAAGMLVTDPDQVAAFAEAVQARGVPLICDEVATGFGRTGAMFASQLCGIRPDLMCLGKGITGGYLPLSATVAASHIYEAFLGEDLGPRTFYHGHSYSGNALACAVAARHLELLGERGLIDRAAAAAERLGAVLAPVRALPAVKEVRRRGLMTGVELNPPAGASRWGRRVCAAAVSAGVLLRPLGDVVVVMPPLSITDDEIDTIAQTLVSAIEGVAADDAGVYGE